MELISDTAQLKKWALNPAGVKRALWHPIRGEGVVRQRDSFRDGRQWSVSRYSRNEKRVLWKIAEYFEREEDALAEWDRQIKALTGEQKELDL